MDSGGSFPAGCSIRIRGEKNKKVGKFSPLISKADHLKSFR